MATQSPFSFLSNVVASLGKGITLPAWLVEEIQRRMVLMANHVLQQEPEAQDRLAAQQGKSVYISWRQFHGQVRVTPAGLLDLDKPDNASDLLLEVSEPSVTRLVKGAVSGTRAPIRIAGDVELARELNWVIDNVRWDLEDDLSRLIGDVPAHKLAQVGRKIAEELRRFVQGAVATFDGLAGKTAASAHKAPSGSTGHSQPPSAGDTPGQPENV